ncbi:Uncharacterized protein QTN25_006744 [Entamoeba marina]
MKLHHVVFFICLFLLSNAKDSTKGLNKKANKYANRLAKEIVDVKVSIDYISKPRGPPVNVTVCKNTTNEQCLLCKEKVIEDEYFCNRPKGNIAKCLCRASQHNWRTMFENVEDKIQTPEEACSFVCNKPPVLLPTNTTDTNHTANNFTNITNITNTTSSNVTSSNTTETNATKTGNVVSSSAIGVCLSFIVMVLLVI